MIGRNALRAIGLLAALALPAPAIAGDIEPVLDRERATYRMSCTDVSFTPEAFWTGDISKDGNEDVIVNTAAVACDRVLGTECDRSGCPMRIYVWIGPDRYSYVGQVRAHGYALRYQYGIRVMEFQISGSRCRKTGATRCAMTARVTGRKLLVLSTE